jgi:hypothetical protein
VIEPKRKATGWLHWADRSGHRGVRNSADPFGRTEQGAIHRLDNDVALLVTNRMSGRTGSSKKLEE